MQTEFIRLLSGKDLRSLKNNKKVIEAVTDQESFDELFKLVFHHERPLVMRAIDAVEKIGVQHREYLQPHKEQLLSVLRSADHKELKWHIAQLVSRLALTKEELNEVWHILSYWALNPNESKIARVNSLQGLFDLCIGNAEGKEQFRNIMAQVEHEKIPSIQARIRKLKSYRC